MPVEFALDCWVEDDNGQEADAQIMDNSKVSRPGIVFGVGFQTCFSSSTLALQALRIIASTNRLRLEVDQGSLTLPSQEVPKGLKFWSSEKEQIREKQEGAILDLPLIFLNILTSIKCFPIQWQLGHLFWSWDVGFSPTSQLFWFQQRSICFLKGSSLVRDFFSRFPEPPGCGPWDIRPVLLIKAPWCTFSWTVFPLYYAVNSHRVLSFRVTFPFLMLQPFVLCPHCPCWVPPQYLSCTVLLFPRYLWRISVIPKGL